jgi:hypothetical protein
MTGADRAGVPRRRGRKAPGQAAVPQNGIGKRIRSGSQALRAFKETYTRSG